MTESFFKELDLENRKTILIQGLPSSLEKNFSKISYAKNITPLLKSRKLDLALIFAVNMFQLKGIIKDISSSLKAGAKLIISYPKAISKITTDINIETLSKFFEKGSFSEIRATSIDNVWEAAIFESSEATKFFSSDRLWEIDKRRQEKSMKPKEEIQEKSLIIEVELPEGISNKRAKEIILNICLLADNEHKMQGGQGLVINDVSVLTNSYVAELI